jgi:hypothetical protein
MKFYAVIFRSINIQIQVTDLTPTSGLNQSAPYI